MKNEVIGTYLEIEKELLNRDEEREREGLYVRFECICN